MPPYLIIIILWERCFFCGGINSSSAWRYSDVKVEAALRPSIPRDFYTKYDKAKFPSDKIGENVLVEMGIPKERSGEALDIIRRNGEFAGIVVQTKTGPFVAIPSREHEARESTEAGVPKEVLTQREPLPEAQEGKATVDHVPEPAAPSAAAVAKRRVYISHGKNKKFVDPLKDLLGFGELDPVVSVERESVSQPVPDKVMQDMRSCGAAIIHVDAEETLELAEGEQQAVINPNVLIEIGAAMALFGRRFILLVRETIELPSNLQGLYEVRYTGEELDGDCTLRLLKAINDIKNHPVPQRYPPEQEQQ